MNFYLTYLIGLSLLLFVNSINTRSINGLSNGGKLSNNKDNYYLIYVNNTHGEYNVFSTLKNQKRQESQVFIESLVDDIHNLIIENKNTFQNPEKLLEIEKASQLKKKRNHNTNQGYLTYDHSDFVYPISSVNDRVVLYAYLSKKLTNELLSRFNNVIIDIVPNRSSTKINQSQSYYNVNDILAETHWKNLSISKNADLHLSLVSQGKYDRSVIKRYDNNYYYPTTAGKDIDLVILDSSFHFNYSEFSNTEDRIVKCTGNVIDGKLSLEDLDTYCGSCDFNHGEIVSATAAGLTNGVANHANVYGVSIPVSSNGDIHDSDVIIGLQFIYETLIRPHKTVINLSLTSEETPDSEYYKQFKSMVDAITEKGGIVVGAAGNEGHNLNDLPDNKFIIPCEFDNVICTGGIENRNKLSLSNVYNVAKYSNYGRKVDLYAPFYVTVDIVKNGAVKKVNDMGTSFSSPIVAGLIASILAENSEIEYTTETVYAQLSEYGKSEIINFKGGSSFLANNGKHIVYSENGKYNGCGVHAGNRPCN